MSYILEALKKSQQQREMGQVPRLQATAFDEPLEPVRSQPWVFAAVGLVALAAAVALYAVLSPRSAPDAPVVVNGGLEQEVSAGVGASQGSVSGSSSGSDLGPSLDSGPSRVVSVEPQVLVVPAPPKPGERLPRGADELRRAVLGPDASPSIERRQPRPAPVAADPAPPERDYAPVPPELIAEIEEFKRTYQAGSSSTSRVGREDHPGPRAAADPALGKSASADAQGSGDASSSGRPALLSSTLRRKLPPFLMTVHVYDENPARRFVYLNGSKVREGELTRDGFFVEQVLTDGAIVRYDDYRFFESP